MWWKFRKAAPESLDANSLRTSDEIRSGGNAPLSQVAKRVKSIEIVTKQKSSLLLSGEYKSRFKGQGMQFSDARVYQYGDDIRHIDWRTTARMQEAYVKTFEEERELNILFVIDVSMSLSFGTSGTSKRETLATALSCLAHSAISNSDRVGLLFVTDKVERYVPPKKGRKHVLRVIDELLTFQPKSKKSSVSSAFDYLSKNLKHGSVIVVASDFFAKLDKKQIDIIARKHDLICLIGTDDRDADLPNVGLLRVEDLETEESYVLPTNSEAFRKLYSDSLKKHRTATNELLKKCGASVLELSTKSNVANELYAFFRARKGSKR